MQLGQGGKDWEFWGFQWQQYAFCYAVPPGWGVEQYSAWAKVANQEDSPEWGVVLSAPDQQGQIQILGTVRPQALTVPGQQKRYQLNRQGGSIGQAIFGSQQGQISLMASFDQPGSAGASLFALVRMPEEQWQQYQRQVLDILGEIYPAQPVQAAK